jgi:hypothetical protein
LFSFEEGIPWGDSLYIKHKSVMLDSVNYFVVEGDILLTEKDYMIYAQKIRFLRSPKQISLQMNYSVTLTGEVRNGEVVHWKGSEISYCYNRTSFGSDFNYVKANFESAVKDWEITCGVKFKYRADLDPLNLIHGNEKVSFVVRKVGLTEGDYVAFAFFPYDGYEKRDVKITPLYFTTSYDRVGVFRHEIGHILGFRHEHIRKEAPPACHDELFFEEFEGGGSIFLATGYDTNSVMHYLCGGAGNKLLQITDSDRVGARLYYGPPLNFY